ncbi:arylsulfatase [Anaerohalosphaera lusitana]|uniref:Arylsulfatase n=1 Tax=Anaerohalosphaera lusitana TaxID=1936003 RepID=A0A1U9NG92_9BACT|nr:sulfatase [Anaerohalosphaera lusitana]AQT66943.1 arylsulfatase [Anaerohalosphaera lusitana]
MQRREFLIKSAFSLGAIGSFSTILENARAASEGKPKRPNILFCIWDDASFPHMGAYGCGWVKTPAFDRVAEEGILFNRAYTPNAKCAPSRACVLTGRNSWQLEEAANHWPNFPAKFKVFTEVLSENDYFVGCTGKGWAPGNSGKIDGKRRQLTGKSYRKRRLEPPARGISKLDYAANFADFYNDKPEDQPFCFWYGAYEPHRGYEYRSGVEKGGKKLDQIEKVPGFWPDDERVRADMLDYAYEIEHADNHLASILKMLEEKGELDNTIVVVTADNGMPFPRCKGQEYEYSNHMPMAAMWKNGNPRAGRVVNDFVSFIDLAPTFLEAAGIAPAQSGMQPIQGKSLMNILTSSRNGLVEKERDHVLIGKERHDLGRPHNWGYPIRGIVKGDYLYIHNFETDRWPVGNPETGYRNCDASPTMSVVLGTNSGYSRAKRYWDMSFGKRPADELYNISEDPECIKNLARDKEHTDLKEKLKTQLFNELKEQKDPRMFGNGHVFDEYEYIRASDDWYEKTVNRNINSW